MGKFIRNSIRTALGMKHWWRLNMRLLASKKREVLLAVAAGMIWSLSGVANSCCARFKLNIVTYLLADVSFSMLLTTVLFVNFDQLAPRNTLML